jgi:hypothetical protein
MEKQLYTQEQLNIKLLQAKNDDIGQTLHRIENRLNNIDSSLSSKINSNFHWTLGLILSIYGLGFAGLISAVGKAYKWF